MHWFLSSDGLHAIEGAIVGTTAIESQHRRHSRKREGSVTTAIAEQVKIAEVLDTLDTTIRQTEAIIEKLKQVKQGLLHDLLTRGIDANGELRPPQSQAPHLYKDSPLGWIPTEWDVAAGRIQARCPGRHAHCRQVMPTSDQGRRFRYLRVTDFVRSQLRVRRVGNFEDRISCSATARIEIASRQRASISIAGIIGHVGGAWRSSG